MQENIHQQNNSKPVNIFVTDFGKSKSCVGWNLIIGMLDPEFRKSKEVIELQHKQQNRTMFFFDDAIVEFGDFVLPTRKNVEDIIKVFDNRKGNNILVHCHAGIGRSTATAIGLWIHSGKSIKDAIDIVFENRKFMWPNDLIISHFDDILGLENKLNIAVLDWKEKQKGKFII